MPHPATHIPRDRTPLSTEQKARSRMSAGLHRRDGQQSCLRVQSRGASLASHSADSRMSSARTSSRIRRTSMVDAPFSIVLSMLYVMPSSRASSTCERPRSSRVCHRRRPTTKRSVETPTPVQVTHIAAKRRPRLQFGSLEVSEGGVFASCTAARIVAAPLDANASCGGVYTPLHKKECWL